MRLRIYRVLFLAAAMLALGVTQVSAASIEADYQLAATYWGEAPSQCSSVAVEQMPLGEVNSDRIGEATEPEPGWYGPCIFRIATATFSYQRCLTAIHEYGHLLGLGHSPDPSSVMYPDIGRQRVWSCIRQNRQERVTRCQRMAATHSSRWFHVCLGEARIAEPWRWF